MSSKKLRCVSCVAAMASNRGIGNNGKLPWPTLSSMFWYLWQQTELKKREQLETDLEFLKKITTDVKDKDKWNAVLMGRRTWDSLESSLRPLPGRLNIVISKSLKSPPNGAHHLCDSVLSALQMLSAPPFSNTVEEILVLGGTEVYREAIESPYCFRIYLTEINKEFEADTFFPTFDQNKYKRISTPSEVPQGVIEENQTQYRICVYEKQL